MNRLRQLLSKRPWLGWAVACVLLAVSIVLYLRIGTAQNPYSVERMTEDVTIKCVETGQEWQMKRGQLEAMLRQRPGMLSPDQGLTNPSTGRPTGFPFEKEEWVATIERINREKQALLKKSGDGAGGSD